MKYAEWRGILAMSARPGLLLFLLAFSVLVVTLPAAPKVVGSPSAWVKYQGNPVLTVGGSPWDDQLVSVFAASVVKKDGSYMMWYAGFPQQLAWQGAIGLATSTDGIVWSKYQGNPVLTASPSGWDSCCVLKPSVVWDGSQFRMWYTGSDGSQSKIGYATSSDGTHWQKLNGDGGPLFSLLDANGGAEYPSVVMLANNDFRIWWGNNGPIFYATSSDGITWTQQGTVSTGKKPMVISDSGIFRMWYHVGDAGIREATSPNGINWADTSDPVNPVITVGLSGSWESQTVQWTSVIKDQSEFKMYYSAKASVSNWAIGFAVRTFTAPPPVGEEVTIHYRGEKAVDFRNVNNNFTAGPGQTLFQATIPQPPAVRGETHAWVLDRVLVSGSGIRLSNDGFVTEFRPSFDQLKGTLDSQKLHIVEADSLDGPIDTMQTEGPTDALSWFNNADAAIGDTVRVSVAAGSSYNVKASFVRVSFRYRLVPQDPSLTSFSAPSSTDRTIDFALGTGADSSPSFDELNPGFGTLSAFFNQRLRVEIRWNFGRAIPTSLLAPTTNLGSPGIELLTDFYRTKPNGVFRVYNFLPLGAVIFISSVCCGAELKELGVPVVGTWRLSLKIEDPTQLRSLNNPENTVQPAGKLKGEVEAEYEVLSSQQMTLAPGESRTFSAPDLRSNGWYVSGFSTFHITSACKCDAHLIQVSKATKGESFHGNQAIDINWYLWSTATTITNPPDSSRTITVTFAVDYWADITKKLTVTDVEASFNSNYKSHSVSIVLGSTMPDANLGFNNLGDIFIHSPSFDWLHGSELNKDGTPVDNTEHSAWVRDHVSDPLRFLWVGAASGYFLSNKGLAVDFIPWATFGGQAAGTWTYVTLEPVPSLTFTKTGGDLLVIDPLNRRLGSDTVNLYNEIPGATYSGPGTVPEVIVIPGALSGSYQIRVTGLTSTQYTVTTKVSLAGVVKQQQTQTGAVTTGQQIVLMTRLTPSTDTFSGLTTLSSIQTTATRYRLTILTDPGGLSPKPSANPASPDGFYDANTKVTLAANTISGYTFWLWSGDGNSPAAPSLGPDTRSVTMDAARTVVAKYAPFTMRGYMTDSDFNTITGFDVVFTSCTTTGCKLTATNPGTYYYNLQFQNNGPTINPTITVTIPGDFVLKGSQPVQVNGQVAAFTFQGGILTLSTGSVTTGQTLTLSVHMDYALKGQTIAGTGPQTSYLKTYMFSTSANTVVAKALNLVASGKKLTAIGGFVTDTNGVAKNGLTVVITDPSGQTTLVKTGVMGDGFYFLVVPAGGPYSVRVYNSMSTQVAIQQSIQVAQDAFVQVDFDQLSPADPAIQGYVKDQYGNGVKGVTVQLLDQIGNVVATTATNTGGYYVFRFSRPGTYTVRVVVPTGYSATTTSGTVTVTQFQTVTVNFQLTKK